MFKAVESKPSMGNPLIHFILQRSWTHYWLIYWLTNVLLESNLLHGILQMADHKWMTLLSPCFMALIKLRRFFGFKLIVKHGFKSHRLRKIHFISIFDRHYLVLAFWSWIRRFHCGIKRWLTFHQRPKLLRALMLLILMTRFDIRLEVICRTINLCTQHDS